MLVDRIGIRGRWVTSAALRALASLAPKAGNTFSRSDLAVAMGEDPRHTTRKLLALQFVTMARGLDSRGIPVIAYTVTAEGAAAIEAAAGGALLVAGGSRHVPAAPGTLRARLWALIRIRKVIGADEAVQLLADAGDPAFVSKRGKANEFLRRWQQAGVLQLSAQVGNKGQKRYVLVTDPGPDVPPFRSPTPAQQQAAR